MNRDNSFLTPAELKEMPFKSIGENNLISRFARFYDIRNIEIGNNVRIDDFCILSGQVKLGNFIHISAYTSLYAKFGIELEDYTGLSPRCTVFSASDDFSGEFLIGPMVEASYTHIIGGKVTLQKYSQLGCNCIVLPGVTIMEGAAAGALSLITHDLQAWKIYKGIPATFLKERSKDLLNIINKISK